MFNIFFFQAQIVNGPEVLSKFVGETEKNVRDLFADAENEQKTRGMLPHQEKTSRISLWIEPFSKPHFLAQVIKVTSMLSYLMKSMPSARLSSVPLSLHHHLYRAICICLSKSSVYPFSCCV
jgi:hypothetical protein